MNHSNQNKNQRGNQQEVITSFSNTQVKNVILLQKKAKERNKQKVFVVEGIKMVTEAPRQALEKVFVSQSFYERNNKTLPMDCQVAIVSDKIFMSMSDTVTPQGIMAVVRQPGFDRKSMLKGRKREGAGCFLILENISDPGNLGTIIRTGEGVGISGIFMSRDTVDIYNPKVIRSTMGSIYRVPFLYVEDLHELANEMKEMGITIYAAHLQGDRSCYEGDYCQDSCFLVGNEAKGLSEKMAETADIKMKIPMEGKVESLNAAIAATVCMYEAYRQNIIKK